MTVTGTFGYMAPELLDAVKKGNRPIATKAVDVFSFGMLMANLLVGKMGSGQPPTTEQLLQYLAAKVGADCCCLARVRKEGVDGGVALISTAFPKLLSWSPFLTFCLMDADVGERSRPGAAAAVGGWVLQRKPSKET